MVASRFVQEAIMIQTNNPFGQKIIGSCLTIKNYARLDFLFQGGLFVWLAYDI